MDQVQKIGHRRSRPARHRRLELRRHPHRLHHRDRRPLQGGDQRRRQRAADCRCTASTSTSRSTRTRSGRRGRSQDLWIKISYPFFHADRIHTPTLFLGGEKDFNVPLVGGEQMYQALRSLGVDTQLVIYPGPVPRHHGAELQGRSAAALSGVVRQVPEEDRADDDVAARGTELDVTAAQPWVSSRFAPEDVLGDLSSRPRACPSSSSPGAFAVPCCRVGRPIAFDRTFVLIRHSRCCPFNISVMLRPPMPSRTCVRLGAGCGLNRTPI